MNRILFTFLMVVLSIGPASAQTLKAVQDRGYLLCGVSEGLPGFSIAGTNGLWTGLDVDFCRAIAAAIFNDTTKVQFFPLSSNDRFSALKDKKVDVLSRNSTWTMERDTRLGIIFSVVNYYDGQGFMVRKSLKIDTALDLAGKSICTLSGTTTELNLADYFRNNRLNYTAQKFATADEALKAYDAKKCDALTSDISQLYAQRSKLGTPIEHIVLPEVISKEPLGPSVRQDDFQWLNIVKWTHFAMINAEELGIGQKTINDAMNSHKPDILRLLGLEGDFGETLGLTRDWAARIIRLVGNYGESYERNVGVQSKLAIARGINSLWDKGGIQYAPPIR